MPVPPIIQIRPGTPDDENFVLGNWLANHRREAPWAHRVTDAVYYGPRDHSRLGYRDIIVGLLQRSRVLIAESDGVNVGELVWQPEIPALHWVYVLKAFRRLKIGTALLEASGLPRDLTGVRVTHPTRSWFTTKATGPGLEERFKAINDPVAPYLIVLGANT